MIAASLLLSMALAAAPAEAKVAEPGPPTGRLLRFIGEQVAFDPIDCIAYRWRTENGYDEPVVEFAEDDVQDDGSSASTRCNEDDLHYRSRYRVVQTIDGEAREAVDFLASADTSHYAESHHALLYILESPDGVLLPSGLAVSVYPTVDGEWASCDADAGSETVEFAGGTVFGRTDGMSPHGIAQRYPASDYLIIGAEAFCIRGRRLPVLREDLDRDLEQLRGAGFPHLPR